jgi:hypothetical protein
MKTLRSISVILVFGLMVMFTAQPAAGRGSEGTEGGTVFERWVNPDAKGTKIRGTLAVYYEIVCNYEQPPYSCPECYDSDFQVKMVYVLTLKKDGDFHVFVGDSGDAAICYLLTDYEEQKTFIDNFIRDTVLPALFPNATDFAYKSIENPLETDAPPFFLTMELELAVQKDRHCRH